MEKQNKPQLPNSSFYSRFFNEEIYIIKENANNEHNIDEKTDKKNTGATAEDIQQQKPVLQINGKSDADVLVLCAYPGKTDIPKDDKEFLSKILAAAGKNFNTISWMNLADVETSWTEIESITKAGYVLAFGITANNLPENISPGEVFDTENKTMISMPALKKIDADKSLKQLLWTGMKKMFDL